MGKSEGSRVVWRCNAKTDRATASLLRDQGTACRGAGSHPWKGGRVPRVHGRWRKLFVCDLCAAPCPLRSSPLRRRLLRVSMTCMFAFAHGVGTRSSHAPSSPSCYTEDGSGYLAQRLSGPLPQTTTWERESSGVYSGSDIHAPATHFVGLVHQYSLLAGCTGLDCTENNRQTTHLLQLISDGFADLLSRATATTVRKLDADLQLRLTTAAVFQADQSERHRIKSVNRCRQASPLLQQQIATCCVEVRNR